MSADELSPDEQAEIDRLMADIDRESDRVGVDWSLVADSLLADHPELSPEPGDAQDELQESPAIGLDVPLLLPILRSLPDGAGTEAFLRALDASGPSTEPPVS